jgi:dTDP-4-amino-4,6-dideoxygalactose transaminase
MIFNSLGSNYDSKFVLRSLFSLPSKKKDSELKYFLEKKYGGKVILLYKGREALKLALKISGIPKGSKVGVNGFTCFVVYQAITEAGYKPVYLDIDGRSLNFNIKNLEEDKNIKALIIQNTLGNPVNIVPIKSFCDKNKILIIEDLAHSVGSFYPNNVEAGCVGDFTALSFSQDKIIDAVSGGALIVRNKKFKLSLNEVKYKNLSLNIKIHDRFYPLLTFLIRKLYPFGLGKPLHLFLKKVSALSEPLGSMSSIEYHTLPGWYSSLAIFEFLKHSGEIEHRKAITRVYLQDVNKKIISPQISVNYKDSSNIRFPIFIENRDDLIDYLKNNGIFISDIWYDAPIAPAKLISKTDYDEKCNESEKVSRQILNLPTHINISEKDVRKISALINQWLNTNQK